MDGLAIGAPGMTLRDWFAGQALNGWVARERTDGVPKYAAEYVYQLADAMIVEREKQQAG